MSEDTPAQDRALKSTQNIPKPQFRGGEGRIVSSTEAKLSMGRSFQRVAPDHIGERSMPTEWEASKRLERGRPQQGPTKMEMEIVFKENPSDVRTYKAAGMADTEIYDLLKNR